MKALFVASCSVVALVVCSASTCNAQEIIWEWEGLEEGDMFGRTVALAPSIDGDELAEILVGSAHLEDTNGVAGHVAVIAGSDGSRLRDFFGTELGKGLSAYERGVEDLDGDGCPDLLFFATSAAPPMTRTQVECGCIPVAL